MAFFVGDKGISVCGSHNHIDEKSREKGDRNREINTAQSFVFAKNNLNMDN